MITVKIKAKGLPAEARFWNILWTQLAPPEESGSVTNLSLSETATVNLPGTGAASFNIGFWYNESDWTWPGYFVAQSYTIEDGKSYVADFKEKVFAMEFAAFLGFPLWLPWEGPPLPRDMFPPWPWYKV